MALWTLPAEGTRFDPRNANKQCAYDNIYQDGLSYEHGLVIDKKFGKGTAPELYRLSKQTRQWEVKGLEQLIAAAKMGYRVYVQVYNEFMSAGRFAPGMLKQALLTSSAYLLCGCNDLVYRIPISSLVALDIVDRYERLYRLFYFVKYLTLLQEFADE